MKKLFYSIFFSLLTMTAVAQDNFIQIIPKSISESATSTRLDIELKNSREIVAVQFDVLMPDGFSLAAKPYDDITNIRYPETTIEDEFEGTLTTIDYEFTYASIKDTARFVIAPKLSVPKIQPIKGTEGSIMTLRVLKDASVSAGLYPILIKNVVLTSPGGEDGMESVQSQDSIAAYVYVGDFPSSGVLDFSELDGYMPADVVAATNELLADKTDITSIDLSGLDNAAATITPANKNAIVYTKAGSDFATIQAGDNVVVGGECANLVLTDGYPFAASKPFTATKASYSRTVPAAGWYSLCLPFAADTADGVTVERYVSKDVEGKTVTFKSGDIARDKPCIFKTETTDVTFSGSNVIVMETDGELADGDFVGTYSKLEGVLEGFYALHPDGSGFGIATATAYVNPFRAYINTKEASAAALTIIHGGEEGTTGIDAVDASANNGAKIYYNLAGQRVARPEKGLYIVDGKMVVIK